MAVAREQASMPHRYGGPGPTVPRVTPARGRPAEILALQRAAGNRAVVGAVGRRPASPAVQAQAPPPVTAPGATSAPTATPGGTVVQGDFLDDVTSGLAEVGGGVRDRALGWISDRARALPGYGLLCVVLGKDVITDAPVPRTGAALVEGFLGLIPGSDTIRRNLQESGATEKAGQWLDEEVPKLGLTFDAVKGLFRRAWDALDVTDLLDPADAWSRLAGIFTAPLRRLRDFAVGAARKLMELVFEGALSLAGGAGQAVMGIIRRAGSVFDRIVADPIGFAGNLVAAVRGGLGQFLGNIGTHLRNGLVGWLTGALGGVVRIPQRFDLRGMLGMAMDLLGLTWDRVRGRLARLVGDRVVGALERGTGIVAELAQRGLAAVTDRIGQFTEGLLDTVLGGIRDWVGQSVVGAAVTRLISMFNPAGAVVQAVIAIYNTVQFFVERAQQLASLASAVFDSIGAIASGNLASAVNWVEQALSRAVPAVLGFLSRLIGIGDVATPVRNVVQRVQGVIDQALDRVIGWLAGLARRAAGALGRARRGGDAPARPGDVRAAVTDGETMLRRPGATEESVRAGLAGLRRRHGLSAAELQQPRPGTFRIHVQRETGDTAPTVLPAVDAAAVRRAIATAEAERGRAVAASAAEAGRLRARGTASAERTADRLTFAHGGGVLRQQGGGTMRAAVGSVEAAFRHAEAERARRSVRAEAMKDLYLSDPTSGPDDLGTALSSHQAMAGARERVGEQGYVPTGSHQDRGTPGGTAAVHAEKLVLLATGAVAIGVSRDMCPDCQRFFRSQAALHDYLVVADPSEVRIFLRDGSVKHKSDFAG